MLFWATFWDYVGPMLGRFGSMLGQGWAKVGPFGLYVGPMLGDLAGFLVWQGKRKLVLFYFKLVVGIRTTGLV